jgi:colanic acid biosynthesis glycosyl transferase WcaI
LQLRRFLHGNREALVVRILIISQYFYPENFRINQLAVALKEQGHELVVLTAQPNYPSGRFFEGHSFFGPSNEHYEGMEVIRVPIFPRGRGKSWQLVLNYLSFVFFATVFGLPRLRGEFDVCVSWCSSPITGAVPAIVNRWLRGTPVAVWVQDLWPETFFAVTKNKSVFLRRGLSALVRWIYQHVDQIWIQSPAYEQSVRAHGGKESQIELVPNWAEDLYDRDRWASVIADNVPPNSFVFAGNLGRAQGLENLLDAAELLKENQPPAHWIFVGEGSLREWLADEVVKRGLQTQVTLLPRRPAGDMPKILKAAAATLITLGNDQVYAQTIPSKVQSCLAAGRPVLGTLFGEPARVINLANCGPVCAPQDPKTLAKTVKEFLQQPEEDREKLGQNGHAYYKAHFTQTLVVSRISGLLEKMRHRK